MLDYGRKIFDFTVALAVSFLERVRGIDDGKVQR